MYSTAIPREDKLEIYPPIQLSRFSQTFENDPHVFYLPFHRKSVFNYGGSSRNAAFKHVTTEWIAFLDDDDRVSRDYLTVLEKEIQEYPNISVVLFRMSCRTCFAPVIPPYPYPALRQNYAGLLLSSLFD